MGQGQLERETGAFVLSFASRMLLHCFPAKGPSLCGKGVNSDIQGKKSKRETLPI